MRIEWNKVSGVSVVIDLLALRIRPKRFKIRSAATSRIGLAELAAGSVEQAEPHAA
jgi:hypothetical protein